MKTIPRVGTLEETKATWTDLRDWLKAVEGIGELRRIEGATSEREIGDITEMLEQREESPAALFREFPGSAPDFVSSRTPWGAVAGRRSPLASTPKRSATNASWTSGARRFGAFG